MFCKRMAVGFLVLSAAQLVLRAKAGPQQQEQPRPKQPAASAAAPAPAPTPSKVRFTFGGDAAQLSAKFLDNVVFVPVHVNHSQPWLFVLDSTAGASSIDAGLAGQLDPGAAANPILNLDGFDFAVGSLPASSRKDFGATFGRPYQGTLGEDFFDALVVSLDYARQTAQVYNPDSFHYAGQGKALPLRLEGGLPVVQAKFEVTGKNFEADFVVDTALSAPVRLSKSYAAAHKILSSHLRRVAATDEPLDDSAQSVRLKMFQLGPYVAQETIADASDLPAGGDAKPRDAKLAGEIGGGMLRRYTAIFDFPHHQLVLEPNNTFPDDDPGDMSGLSVAANGPGLKRFEVVSVQPGSPGAEAKVQKGDVIAGVDGEPAADLSLADLRGLFRQVGHNYKLLIDRNGQEVQATIKMRPLL